jgi:hypothetical protein
MIRAASWSAKVQESLDGTHKDTLPPSSILGFCRLVSGAIGSFRVPRNHTILIFDFVFGSLAIAVTLTAK